MLMEDVTEKFSVTLSNIWNILSNILFTEVSYDYDEDFPRSFILFLSPKERVHFLLPEDERLMYIIHIR